MRPHRPASFRRPSRVYGGPPRATGTGRMCWCRTTRAARPRGSTPICIGSRAISATPLTGTERRGVPRRPIRSRWSGGRSRRHCCRRQHRRGRDEAPNERCGKTDQAAQGHDRRLASRRRHGGARAGHLERQAVLRSFDRIRQAIRTGLGLKAQINLKSVFDRKNYFYPDLPQGYQISQYKSPLVGEGEVVVDMPDGEAVTVGIERLHLEQDAGKSLHEQHASMSLVDLNRCGVGLMEIVSRPDLRSDDEARGFLAKLRTILRYLGTCDGDMEKGSLRADVNVSVRRPGEPLGTRC